MLVALAAVLVGDQFGPIVRVRSSDVETRMPVKLVEDLVGHFHPQLAGVTTSVRPHPGTAVCKKRKRSLEDSPMPFQCKLIILSEEHK